MLVNWKSILCYVIFQTLVNVSHETPTSIENKNRDEVNESDIEKVIAKKEAEEKETNKQAEEKIDEKNKKETENNSEDEEKLEKIKYLEKEKRDLYHQISKSIDESVILLQHTNDTEAQLGIDFMQDLKDHLNKLNGIDSEVEDREGNIIQRRSHPGRNNHRSKKKVKITYEEISDLFKSSGVNATQKLRNENDLEMQRKLNEWILQRQLEKKKILEYKSKSKHGKEEKCPRQGYGKKKIKVNGRSRKIYLPCCRKCCKNSYMGCL